MTEELTAAQIETIHDACRAGMHELLLERPDLLSIGVANLSAIFVAGARAGARAIIEATR